jgi:hypothetical protein
MSFGKKDKSSLLNSSCNNDSSFFNSSDISIPFIKSYANSVISASPCSTPKRAEKDYFSICSHKFQSEQLKEESLEGDLGNPCNFEIGNKSFETTFYFEFDYLMLWSKEYLKSIYPELNLILIITLDDQVFLSEKIFLTKTIETQKYTPLLKKDDFQSQKKNFRFLKTVLTRLHEIHKIQLDLATFCKGKLVVFSSEEIFINLKNEVQRHKYTMYQNMNMNYSKKKIANVLFSFIFQKESNIPSSTPKDNSRSFYDFQKVVDFSTLEDSSTSQYIYYSLPNLRLHNAKSIQEDNKNFFSINDIEEAEYNSGMKELKVNIDKLLQYISKVRKKYDLYHVMRSLYNSVTKKEFDEQKLVSYQEKLVLRLEELYHEVNGDNSAQILDKITIPYIFENLKNIFLKFLKTSMKSKKSKIKKDYTYNTIINQDDSIMNTSRACDNDLIKKFVELLIKTVKIGFDILLLHENLEIEVIISFLNFLCRVVEENFEIEFDLDKNETNFKYSEDLFLHLIQHKSMDALMWSLLKNTKNQGICLYLTSILSKLIKKNPSCLTLTKLPNYQELISHIFNTMGNNSLIMTNIFSILLDEAEKLKSEEDFQLITTSKVKEIFLNFTLNNFDLIHESLLHFIKTLIMKNKNFLLNKNDYSDLINLFSCALVLMKNKITHSDTEKIYKWISNMITIIYTIVNLVNSLLKNSDYFNLIEKLCWENKLVDLLIDVFSSFLEKTIFSHLDRYYDRLDINSINLKSLIMRTMFHTVNLIKSLKIEKIVFYFNLD